MERDFLLDASVRRGCSTSYSDRRGTATSWVKLEARVFPGLSHLAV